MAISAIVNPLRSAIQSAIVGAVRNKLFTVAYNIKANPSVVSLPHYKNELVYNASTWAEWGKSGGTAADSTGMEYSSDGESWITASVNTSLKGSINYGLLFNIISNSMTLAIGMENYYTGSTVDLANGGAIGNIKIVFTTQATIIENKLMIYSSNLEPVGKKVKYRDVRLFELPPNSEIEADFTNLTADALMLKYNPAVIVPGDIKATVLGRTLKNELDYTYATYAEWTKVGAVGDSTGLAITCSATTAASALISTVVKASTKYGLLFNIVSNALSAQKIQIDNNLTGALIDVITTGITGNKKVTLTTQATITINQLKLLQDALGDNTLVVKIKDLCLFELPTGSEIESDFTNMTADQLTLKYPMAVGTDGKTGGVKSVGGVNITQLRSVGKNLFDKSNCLLNYSLNGYTGALSSSAGIFTSSFISVQPNQNCYLRGGTISVSGEGGGSLPYAFYDSNKALISYGFVVLAGGYKTAPANARFIRFSAYIVDLGVIQLEEGSTTTVYEPYRQYTCLLPTDLKQVGSVSDGWDASTGTLTKRISDWVELDGSLDWLQTYDLVGYKKFELYGFIDRINSGQNSSASLTVVKNNRAVLNSSIGDGIDFTYFSSINTVVIFVADTDSGYPEVYTLSENEIKAYFYGWKMCASDGTAYVSGTKYWKKITDGTGITSTLPTATYTGYTPYKMIYQLANPQVKKYEKLLLGNDLKAERNGTLYVEKVDGSTVNVVPNLQLQFERSV